jgi:hypothetical protein
MSNAIRFLETMGQNADLRHAAKPTLYKALNEQQVDQDAQWAILRGDTARLGTLLGARSEMVCGIQAAFPECDVVDVGLEIRLIA